MAAAVLLAAVIFYALFIRNPRDDGNYPAVPDTPAPSPHSGLFVSDHGSLEFNGDGETIIIDFDPELAELSGLPEGRQEGTYTFLSGDLPPHGSFDIRYDAAHEICITAGESTASEIRNRRIQNYGCLLSQLRKTTTGLRGILR